MLGALGLVVHLLGQVRPAATAPEAGALQVVKVPAAPPAAPSAAPPLSAPSSPAIGPTTSNGRASANPAPAPPSPRPGNQGQQAPSQVPATPPKGPVLSLATAEAQALARQPQITQALAQTAAADARADEQFAPMLPQVQGNASYQRRVGSLPSGTIQGSTTSTFNTSGNWNFGISANQTVWDFGQNYGQFKAAKANAEAQRQSEESTRQSVLYGVRSAYLQAWARRALVDVDKDALMNQERHLQQVQGQVNVGTRPEIDLAQVKADRASAELALISAENQYETAKAQLNQAMGVEGSTDYEVTTERIGELPEEQMQEEHVAAMGIAQRPEMKTLAKQAEANERSLSAVKGSYGPTLGVSTGFTEGGPELDSMRWNWNAQAQLTWPIFQGGLTNARVREATANQAVTRSQVAIERQQVRFDVVQARLAVRAGKAELETAKEVESNAREQLRLAEARYQAGAGSIIELQDAQVAATTASGQVVQADYDLSVARAQLLKAIGRR
ncbi:MAG TPA: TolC family protein [Polyangiaceae bacterium]|jgi:outer membrane protein|nr:TolC family protein [Polyangiaceae bacterium]